MNPKKEPSNASGAKKRAKSTHRVSLRSFVSALKNEPNEFRRKLFFVGFLFERLARQGVTSYLVGGQAVEVYTAGQFVTGDIDITVTDKVRAEKVLSQMGFARAGMIWLNEKLNIAVQIVTSYPTITQKARKIEVQDFQVNVVGVEDLIIDRLVAAKHWRSNPKLDMEQAFVLLSIFRNSIDMDYLRKRSSEERVRDFLNQISRQIREIRRG